MVKGLLRRRKLHFLSALRTEFLSISKTQVRQVSRAVLTCSSFLLSSFPTLLSPLRQVVMEYLQMSEEEEEMEEPSNTLSGRTKAMSLESWLRMLNHIFTFLLSYLRCVKVSPEEVTPDPPHHRCWLLTQGTVMVITEVCQEAAGISAHTYSPSQPQPTQSVFSMPTETLPPPLPDTPIIDIPIVNGISTLEEQDVEERLEQLLLQDDLTDARIEEMASSAMEDHTNGTIPVSAENHVDEEEEAEREDGDQAKEETQQDSFQSPDWWACPVGVFQWCC